MKAMQNDVYQVHSMHGPTVFFSDHDGYRRLVLRMWQASINAGPYRIIYLPTGEEVARFDRNENGTERPGTDTVESALAR